MRINGLIVAEANWFAFITGIHSVPNLPTGLAATISQSSAKFNPHLFYIFHKFIYLLLKLFIY